MVIPMLIMSHKLLQQFLGWYHLLHRFGAKFNHFYHSRIDKNDQ